MTESTTRLGASTQILPTRGTELACAMYFLYGPYQQLLLGLEEGDFMFTRLPRSGKSAPESYVTDGEPKRIPANPEVYGIGGLREEWPPAVREFEVLDRRRLKMRYGGSMVCEFDQILDKGGFFAFPQLLGEPDDRYRLRFESNPIAHITERAGGKASTGAERIPEVEPTSIGQRVPTYIGDPELVSEFEKLAGGGGSP